MSHINIWMRSCLLSTLVLWGLMWHGVTSNDTSWLSEGYTAVGGVWFGRMKTLLQTAGRVYHMEVDLANPDRILFSDDFALRAVTDTGELTLAGAPVTCKLTCSGYREGTAATVLFNRVSGFIQLSAEIVIVVDMRNNCLRKLNRKTSEVVNYAGQCGKSGFRDGKPALFLQPWSAIKDPSRPNHLIVTDSGNSAVRQVDYITGVTTTLFSADSGLNYPSSITFDTLGQNMIISNRHFIAEKSNTSRVLVNQVGMAKQGFKDGVMADFNFPRELVSLSDTVRLIADEDNARLRVMSTVTGSVSSICSGIAGIVDGRVMVCGLDDPLSLLINDGLIYIGESGAIRTLPFSVPGGTTVNTPDVTVLPCPASITTAFDQAGDAVERLANWTSPLTAAPVKLSLEVGKDSRYFSIPADCQSKVYVTDHYKHYTTTVRPPRRPDSVLPCPDAMTAVIKGEKTRADVSWTTPYGVSVSVSLSEGTYDYHYELPGGFECYFTINVTFADSVRPCPVGDITSSTDPVTNIGTFSFTTGRGKPHQLQLPLGSYNYLYDHCSTTVNIIDHRLRRRVDFVARYGIKCTELEDQSAYSVFLTTAELPAVINEMCAGECKRDASHNIAVSCINNITSIAWATDLLLPGNAEKIPDHVMKIISPNMNKSQALKVFLYTHMPPVVFPLKDEDGYSTRLILTTVCADGSDYDSLSNTCSDATAPSTTA